MSNNKKTGIDNDSPTDKLQPEEISHPTGPGGCFSDCPCDGFPSRWIDFTLPRAKGEIRQAVIELIQNSVMSAEPFLKPDFTLAEMSDALEASLAEARHIYAVLLFERAEFRRRTRND